VHIRRPLRLRDPLGDVGLVFGCLFAVIGIEDPFA
jgi:hypothetical protein